jgi:peptidoglycan hydrolase CwlO-like protein
MKLSSIISESELSTLNELNATVPGATMTGTTSTPAPGVAPAQDPQAAAKSQAMAAMQVKNQRDSIQKQIKDIDEQIRSLNQQKSELQRSLTAPAATV